MRTGAQKGWEGPVALDDQLAVGALDQLGPQLATGALVQLGILRTGALDQCDDDGDCDGDDDDEQVGLSSEAWRVSNEAEPK